MSVDFIAKMGSSWSYGSRIKNYLWNHFLSTLTLWVRIPLSRRILETAPGNLLQISGFLRVLCWPPRYYWTIVESGAKQQNQYNNIVTSNLEHKNIKKQTDIPHETNVEFSKHSRGQANLFNNRNKNKTPDSWNNF